MAKKQTEAAPETSKPECKCAGKALKETIAALRKELREEQRKGIFGRITEILNAPKDRRTKMFRTLYNELNQGK